MKILVFVKQVPDTDDVKLDPKTGNLKREGVQSMINPPRRKRNRGCGSAQGKVRRHRRCDQHGTSPGRGYAQESSCSRLRRGIPAVRPCIRRRRYPRYRLHPRKGRREDRRLRSAVVRPPRGRRRHGPNRPLQLLHTSTFRRSPSQRA